MLPSKKTPGSLVKSGFPGITISNCVFSVWNQSYNTSRLQRQNGGNYDKHKHGKQRGLRLNLRGLRDKETFSQLRLRQRDHDRAHRRIRLCLRRKRTPEADVLLRRERRHHHDRDADPDRQALAADHRRRGHKVREIRHKNRGSHRRYRHRSHTRRHTRTGQRRSLCARRRLRHRACMHNRRKDRHAHNAS